MSLATIEMTGWRELEAAWKQAPHIVREEALRALTLADALLEREVKDLTPTASGLTRGGIFSHEQMLDSGALGVVGTAQPHAVYVELGTRPHPVSKEGQEALQDWAKTKFGITEREARGVAFLIARKIRLRGTPAVMMFHRAFEANRDPVQRIFEQARDRIAARLGGEA